MDIHHFFIGFAPGNGLISKKDQMPTVQHRDREQVQQADRGGNHRDEADEGLEIHRQLVQTRSIDGFVIIIPKSNDPRVKLLRELKVPFILHGQTMDEPDYPFYDIDNVAIGYKLTKNLIDSGHNKIAFINGPSEESFVARRFSGYQNALTEAGIRINKKFQISGKMTKETGLIETIRLFQRNEEKPTGMIASNMRILQGIFEGAKALGLKIPTDISVVAHDDVLPDCPAEVFPVAISRTQAPLVNSWDPLAELLKQHLDGAKLKTVQKR